MPRKYLSILGLDAWSSSPVGSSLSPMGGYRGKEPSHFALWGGLHGTYLIINHGWRSLAGSGSAAGGQLARAIAVLLTFTTVVIAWVAFRATTFAATLAMRRGMTGMNGVTLPAAIGAYLQGYAGNAIAAGGLTPITGLDAPHAVVWLILGLLIVWPMPNTQQWPDNFSPAWDDVTHRSRLVWQPTRRHAILIGVMFILALFNCTRPGFCAVASLV